MENQIEFTKHDFNSLKKTIMNGTERISLNFFNGLDIESYDTIKEFRECLKNKKLNNINIVDGISLALPLSLKNLSRIKRLQGPTFTHLFLKDKELNLNKKHFFIGIGESELNNVLRRYPVLKRSNLSGHNHSWIKGYFFSEEEIQKIIYMIKRQKSDYVWVGVGCPRQQILTKRLSGEVSVKNFFNVGVAMEFIKGSKKRAPRFFQIIGLEWFYRLLFSQFNLTIKRVFPSFKGMIKSFVIAKVKKSS